MSVCCQVVRAWKDLQPAGQEDSRYSELAPCRHLQVPDQIDGHTQHRYVREHVENCRGKIQGVHV